MRQEPDVGERVVDPRGRRGAPTIDDARRRRGRARRRTASSVSDSSLSGGDRSIGTPRGLELGDRRPRPSESPSPTQRSIATPSGRRVARAAVGGDDEADRRRPSRARRASSASRGRRRRRRRGSSASIRAMLPRRIRPPRPDARLRPCPTPRSIPSIQRVLDAAARKGVTLEVDDLRRVDPHRRRGRGGRRRRARPDREVARLRRPRATTARSRSLCLVVRPQPGRRRPAGGRDRRSRTSGARRRARPTT